MEQASGKGNVSIDFTSRCICISTYFEWFPLLDLSLSVLGDSYSMRSLRFRPFLPNCKIYTANFENGSGK